MSLQVWVRFEGCLEYFWDMFRDGVLGGVLEDVSETRFWYSPVFSGFRQFLEGNTYYLS